MRYDVFSIETNRHFLCLSILFRVKIVQIITTHVGVRFFCTTIMSIPVGSFSKKRPTKDFSGIHLIMIGVFVSSTALCLNYIQPVKSRIILCFSGLVFFIFTVHFFEDTPDFIGFNSLLDAAGEVSMKLNFSKQTCFPGFCKNHTNFPMQNIFFVLAILFLVHRFLNCET